MMTVTVDRFSPSSSANATRDQEPFRRVLRIRAWLICRRAALVATILPRFVGVNNNAGRFVGMSSPTVTVCRSGYLIMIAAWHVRASHSIRGNRTVTGPGQGRRMEILLL